MKTTSVDPIVIVGGGQSGLAGAHAVRKAGLEPLVLEAGDRPVGSWPEYYDSLTLFSPARYDSLPGMPFPGDPERYPHRDEVVDYLERYADGLGVAIRTETRVERVETQGRGFRVRTAGGGSVDAASVIAASGSYGNPHRPVLPGQDSYRGKLLHVAEYREPAPFVGERVVVVGAGNSAVQVAYELSAVASVTIASRAPLRFLAQRRRGRDLHDWATESGFDDLPPAWLAQVVEGTLVLETGEYRAALEAGRLDRRPMFSALRDDGVVWSDGTHEPVDAVLLATGYRPDLPYLRDLGAVDSDGTPLHAGGLSLTHPGLAYLGLEFQRSFASNTLRGVARDAEHVIGPLAAWAVDAPKTVGL